MFVVGDHGRPIQSIAFSPDGLSIVSGGKDGVARIWNLSGGGSVKLEGHAETVFTVAYRPDGLQVATGSADRTVRLWKADGGKIARVFAPSLDLDGPISAVAFLNDGQMLIAAVGNRINSADPGGVRIWKLDDGKNGPRLGEPNGAWSLATTPHGKTLAWGGGNKRVALWDITRSDRQIYPPLKIGVQAISLSSDGRRLAATDDWDIRLWDTADKKEQVALVGHKGRVSSLAFSPDGHTLASGCWDKHVTFWDVDTHRARQSYAWGIGRVLTVAFSPDGLLAAAAGDSGQIVVWDVE